MWLYGSQARNSSLTTMPRMSTVRVVPTPPRDGKAFGQVATCQRGHTQPSGCGSAEIHTAAGTTVDEGQNRPTRSTCSTPFCSAHTTVCSSHIRADHASACSFWVS